MAAQDLMVGLQVAITLIDATIFMHIKENALCFTLIYLEMNRGHFKHLL
jgi:hypothetical protein